VSREKLVADGRIRYQVASKSKNLECEKCNKRVNTNYSVERGKYANRLACLLLVLGGCCCLCCIPLCNSNFHETIHKCPRCSTVLLVEQPFEKPKQP
jgi:hypothetical protein